MKLITATLAVIGIIAVIKVAYFKHKDYHVTICKEAGWEFIGKKIKPHVDNRTLQHFYVSLSTSCHTRY
jgi:hypothetical protein